MSEDKIQLLHDNPLEFDNTTYDNDGLEFDKYTKVLTNAIINTPTPFTIGIYGKWGKGKTSFLKMIEHKIQQEKDENKTFITVWFNAWKYEKDNDPIVSLLMAINDTLENQKSSLDKSKKTIIEKINNAQTYFKHIILTSMNLKTKVGTKEFNVTNSIDLNKAYLQAKAEIEKNKTKDILSELINDNSYIKIFDFLKEVENILKEANIHLVVFIDDLDRCMPQNAVDLLESIKLILDIKGFTFIMGIANEIIEEHLNYRYETKFGIKGQKHGKEYMEKIIQLPFFLPKYSQKIDKLVEAIFKKNSSNNDNVKNVINAIANHKTITPRFLLRIINQAKVHSEISKLINQNIKEDIDIFATFTFIMLLEDLYKEQYNLFEVMTDNKITEFKKIIENKEQLNKQIKDEKILDDKTKYKSDFEKLIEFYKNNEDFKKLIDTSTSKQWLENKQIRELTFEFVDEVSNISEDEIIQKEELKFENQSLEKIKEYLESLEEKIKDDKSFNDMAFNENEDSKDSYKTFIKVKDKDDNEFEFSKFLVINKWYEEFSNINKEDESEYKDNKKFNHPYKPVVGINIKNIDNFCKWLNDKDDGYKYSLPSKEQFEYIASAKGKRKYPWGDKYNNKYCNNNDIGLNKTSIVGAFKDGNSKDGICDMSGNTDVWTSTTNKNNEYLIKVGSWFYSVSSVFAVSYDFFNLASNWYNDLGFLLTRTK